MHYRFIKFLISRLVGTIVDTAVLWILTHYLFFSYVGQYIVSPSISFEMAMLHNYFVSYFWIWNGHIQVKCCRDFFTRLIPYNLSVVVGFLIKMGFLLLFERIFSWDVIYCNLAALVISGVANFYLSELYVFRKHPPIPVSDDYVFAEAEEEEEEVELTQK